MNSSFSKRWLSFAGKVETELDELCRQAQARARRYEKPLLWIYPLVLFFFEWLAPLFFLRQFKRLKNISDENFRQLLNKIDQSKFSLVRLVALLAVHPLMELLVPEHRSAIIHPLQKYSLSGSSNHFDVLVIGSGAGGAPLARELSQAGYKIGIIEKGGLANMDSAQKIVEKHYVGQGMLGAISRSPTLVFAGSALGGTTVINSGTCLRPSPQTLAHWDELADTNFSSGQLDVWMDEVEKIIGVGIPSRSLMSASSLRVEAGLLALSRAGSFILPRNAPDCSGSGRCCFICPTGAKQSTDRVFLPEAVKNGAEIFSETEAFQIMETSAGAGTGVSVTIRQLRTRSTQTLTAKKLVLSAGALFTPTLIRQNRLGSHWKQAGNNLRIHPASKVHAHFDDIADSEFGIPQGLGYKPPELPRVSMEGVHVPKSVSAPFFGKVGDNFRWWFDRSDQLASYGLMIRDRRAGRVRQINNMPAISYSLHPQDSAEMGQGLLLIAEVFFKAGATKILFPTIAEQNEFTSFAELKKIDAGYFAPEKMMISGFHPQGTAAMGALVDLELKLKGTQNIYVCDTSVFPDSPGVNPMVVLMALSLRLAHTFKSDRSAFS